MIQEFHFWSYTQRIRKQDFREMCEFHVYCSIIHNSQDIETTQMPISGGMDTKDVVCVCVYIYIYMYVYIPKGLPDGARGKEPAWQYRRHKRCRSNPWVRKTPWRRAWQPTPVFFPGESHGQRSLAGCSPQGHTVRHDWSNLAYIPKCIPIYAFIYMYTYLYMYTCEFVHIHVYILYMHICICVWCIYNDADTLKWLFLVLNWTHSPFSVKAMRKNIQPLEQTGNNSKLFWRVSKYI